jgi:hypothetical protein
MNIRVVGAYLPSLKPERLRRYVEEDQLRYINVDVPALRAQGFLSDVSDEYIAERAAEIAEEKEQALQSAALFEIEVTHHQGDFDPFAIEGAWEPAYLDLAGRRVVAEYTDEIAGLAAFRVAFYVHDWKRGSTLRGPSGTLALPSFRPVPERLWQLAPYAIVD